MVQQRGRGTSGKQQRQQQDVPNVKLRTAAVIGIQDKQATGFNTPADA
jgi:hypothetical protein